VFFDWRGGMASQMRAADSPQTPLYASESFIAVKSLLGAYETAADANLGHPYFSRSRPRTMLIDEVEAIWAPIAEEDDWSGFDRALNQIEDMGEAYGMGNFTIN
jgi:hypothetical protein